MKRGLALSLAVGVLGATLASAQQAAAPGGVPSPGLPRVSLSLANPSLGQPAPAPGFFDSLASGLLRTARQAAGSFLPAMNFIPDGGPAPAPPVLPPSLLPQAGNRFASATQAALPSVSDAGAQAAPGRGQAMSPGAPVLPGGIIPLRASQAEPMTVLQRTPLSLTAKAEALRAPLRNLASLGEVPSEVGAERASRAGRQISEIVTDDGSSEGPSAAAMPGPEAGQAMGEAELDSLRDSVAEPPSPAPGAAGGAAFAGMPDAARFAKDFSPKAPSAFGEAVDAAEAYGRQSAASGRAARAGSLEDAPAPAAPRLDLSLLVLHVFEDAVHFARAEEEALARRARAFRLGAGADAAPRMQASSGALVGPPAPPPTYALGSRGPAAGADSEAAPVEFSQALSAGAGGKSLGAFDLPDASGLPRRVPLPLAGSLLLPLIGVALFYLSEFRR